MKFLIIILYFIQSRFFWLFRCFRRSISLKGLNDYTWIGHEDFEPFDILRNLVDADMLICGTSSTWLKNCRIITNFTEQSPLWEVTNLSIIYMYMFFVCSSLTEPPAIVYMLQTQIPLLTSKIFESSKQTYLFYKERLLTRLDPSIIP